MKARPTILAPPKTHLLELTFVHIAEHETVQAWIGRDNFIKFFSSKLSVIKNPHYTIFYSESGKSSPPDHLRPAGPHRA